MNPRLPAVAEGKAFGFIGRLVVAYEVAHLALIFLWPGAATRFMLGDRALDRTHKVETLLDAGSIDDALRTLMAQGAPGDYVLFAPAYGLFGPAGVMLQNLTLAIAGLCCLYRLAGRLGGERVARIASLVYVLLPASIFHPQAFVSEGITNPLLIVATYILALGFGSDRARPGKLALAGLLLAVVGFVRPVLVLFPVAAATLVVLRGSGPARMRWREAAVLAVLGLSLPLGAVLTERLLADRYPAGESVGGLGSNLYLRARRMAAMGGVALPDGMVANPSGAGAGPRSIAPRIFVGLVAERPLVYSRTVLSDAFNLVANPGVAMVAGRYFGLFDLGEHGHADLDKWREVRERDGMVAMLAQLWRASPAGLVALLAGALPWGAMLLVACHGAIHLARARAVAIGLRLWLLGLPLCLGVLTSLLAGYSRWDHRSPVEFVLAILVAFAFAERGRPAGDRGAALDRPRRL